ncbi:universal stress protein [Microlunatus sp. Gsoil 973]|uniref:universal stress protein n=1 Tax=Microlunatus sp. Gsoil 973 TaxID=2672569 RepID=UPI00351AD0E7
MLQDSDACAAAGAGPLCACRLPSSGSDLVLLQSCYPEVRATVLHVHGQPHEQLARHAAEAQLLVVGRHHTGPLGFEIGSTARRVLHRAGRPVAVVPTV